MVMRDVLKTGSEFLAGMQARFAAQRVLYSRGGSSTRIPATLGRTPFDVQDANGGLLRVQSEDFVIRTAYLKLDAIEITPISGDRITFNGEIFEVCPPGPGIPEWAWDGPHHQSYRIHTKQVGTVP